MRDQDGEGRQHATTVDVKYLAKTEVDRITDTVRAEVTAGLLLIADKLYRRNPREWKKAGMASREAAVERLRLRQYRSFPSSAARASGRRRRWPSPKSYRATVSRHWSSAC